MGDKHFCGPRHSTFIAQDADRFFLTGPDTTSARQGDLFRESQSDQFDEDAPTPVYRADLYKILAEARAAKTLPWEPKQVSLYGTIF